MQAKEPKIKSYPLISHSNYCILDLVTRLHKAPDVKRMLNKNWTLDKKPGKGGGSIFDDFLADDDSSSEEEEEQQQEQISINNEELFASILHETMN